MKEQTYTQCRLKKNNSYQVCWIDSNHATKGKTLKIKVDNEWQDGWVVESAGTIKIDKDYALLQSQQYKHTRETSDI